jgi:soluble lytic murein transglycosylase-like protein
MPKARTAPRKPRRGRARGSASAPRRWALAATEAVAFAGAVLAGDLGALGWATGRFHGASLLASVLPFAIVVLALGAWTALVVAAWLRVRPRLAGLHPRLPLAGAVLLVAAAGAAVATPEYRDYVAELRHLTDGPGQARRAAIAHQVWAAYRRSDLAAMRVLLERSGVYEPAIRDAAAAFRLDPEVLMGIAATESSFHPRPSADGGHGLFQITAVPESAEAAARRRLDVAALDRVNQRHNAFVGAATFRAYLDQMRGDPFLALLAYNIGPRNGGLVSIMEQYGARDFVTIQPYLKHLPRDYPVRVLTHALAYRIWKREGRLLAYQEDDNAARVQRMGIPGLLHADA